MLVHKLEPGTEISSPLERRFDEAIGLGEALDLDFEIEDVFRPAERKVRPPVPTPERYQCWMTFRPAITVRSIASASGDTLFIFESISRASFFASDVSARRRTS